jgi:glucosamine--fructose-6-phosphate aminotransferase (isomerizing)
MLQAGALATEMATELTDFDRCVVAARGFASSNARELALKLMEACYMTAVGMSSADLLHGPIAHLGRNVPVLLTAIESDRAVLPGLRAMAGRCLAMGSPMYAIGGGDALAEICQMQLPGPALPAYLAPIAAIVPGQLLTEALARAKGLDPDAPRGLGKVTQTET